MRQRLISVVTVLVLVCGLLLPFATDSATAAATYTVSGTVREGSLTGPVIADATVKLDSISVKTNSSGQYTISGVTAGSHTLGVYKTGYNSNIRSFTVSQNMTVNVNLTKSPTGTYTVSGVIREGSSTGPVLADATVKLDNISVKTNSSGAYTITGVAGGSHTLGVYKTGYKSNIRTITVSANMTVNVYITRVGTLTVSGVVRDGSSTGPLLADATVKLDQASVKTNANGQFTFTAVTSGNHTLGIYKAGYKDNIRTISVTSNITNLSMVLTPITYSVSGKVTSGSSSGSAVEGATVKITTSDGDKTAATNSTGNYTITGVRPGTFTITATKTGFNNYSGSVTVVNANITNQNIVMTSAATAEPFKDMPNGQAVSVSAWASKNLYAIVAPQPTTKSEGNYDLGSTSQYTLTISGSSSHAANVNSLAKLTTSKTLPASLLQKSKQIDVDNKMRIKENQLLASGHRQTKQQSSVVRAAPSSITVGTQWNNVNIFDVNDNLVPINTTCRYVSNHAYFFVDNRDIDTMESKLAAYATAFESINTIDRNKFGNPNINGTEDTGNTGKVIILFSRELTGGILGYFYAADKFSKSTYSESNEADIFYMTTDDYSQETIMGTLAHEYQHMIYFDQHHNRGVTNTMTWLNEGLSGLAEYYNGYNENHNAWMTDYLGYSTLYLLYGYPISLTHWTSMNYGLSGLFVHYLHDQYGENAIRNLVRTDKVGIAAVESIAGTSFNNVFNNFTRALVLSNTGESSDSKYNFTSINLKELQTYDRGGLYGPTYSPSDGPIGLPFYPYQLAFIKVDETPSALTLSGQYGVGTAFGLNTNN